MLVESFLGLALYPWHKMVREDGSRVTLEKTKSFVEELVSSWMVFKTHPCILFFWPWCWAINYYISEYSQNKLGDEHSTTFQFPPRHCFSAAIN
jgi:hypothetical protein